MIPVPTVQSGWKRTELRTRAVSRLRLKVYHFQAFLFWQRLTIAPADFAGSFPPMLRFESHEIHNVFLRASNLALAKNPSPKSLVELFGVAGCY
ncbi:MAG: hypothetical protein MSC56_03445 [Clostridiales bacterium]|nr:hypothetical protein [Clostridiales bacterium]